MSVFISIIWGKDLYVSSKVACMQNSYPKDPSLYIVKCHSSYLH